MNFRRLTLTRRDNGATYLDRWGIETRFGGVYLHKMTAPDPGGDPHNHPWVFRSIILRGGYVEHVRRPDGDHVMAWSTRRGLRVHRFPLEWAHRIDSLSRVPTWTLVIRGRRVREWGFLTRGGFVVDREYVNRGLDVDGVPPEDRDGNVPKRKAA